MSLSAVMCTVLAVIAHAQVQPIPPAMPGQPADFIQNPLPPTVVTNKICPAAIPIDCGMWVMGDTTNSTYDGTFSCMVPHTGPQVWYYTEVETGFMEISLCNSTGLFDTRVSVYSACECNNMTCFNGADNGCAVGVKTYMNIPVTRGRYFIMVHGLGQTTGPFQMTLRCTTMIPPASCPIVPGSPILPMGANVGTQVELSEPSQSSPALYALFALLPVVVIGVAFVVVRHRRSRQEPKLEIDTDAPVSVMSSMQAPCASLA